MCMSEIVALLPPFHRKHHIKPGLERNPMFLTFVFGAVLRMFTFKKTSARELDHIWRSVYLLVILMVTRGGCSTILPQSELSSLKELNLVRGTFQVSNRILSLQHHLNPFHKQCTYTPVPDSGGDDDTDTPETNPVQEN